MNDNTYIQLLESAKQRIKQSQHQVAMYVNSELLFTYWNIGYALNQERDRQGWGAKVVDQLAKDLKTSFPQMKGLSKRNLQYMMRFATEWDMDGLVQPAVEQLDDKATKGLESGQDSIVPPLVAQIQSTDNEGEIFVQQPVAQLEDTDSQSGIKVQQAAAQFQLVEYTLKQTSVPLGVAEYKLVQELPEQLKGLNQSVTELKDKLKNM